MSTACSRTSWAPAPPALGGQATVGLACPRPRPECPGARLAQVLCCPVARGCLWAAHSSVPACSHQLAVTPLGTPERLASGAKGFTGSHRRCSSEPRSLRGRRPWCWDARGGAAEREAHRRPHGRGVRIVRATDDVFT